jgi:hypothetical protein
MALKRKDNNKDRIKEGDQHPGRDPLDGALRAYVPALFHVAGRHVAARGKYLASDICWPPLPPETKGKRVAGKICTQAPGGPPPPPPLPLEEDATRLGEAMGAGLEASSQHSLGVVVIFSLELSFAAVWYDSLIKS